jgi:hypothetical protein
MHPVRSTPVYTGLFRRSDSQVPSAQLRRSQEWPQFRLRTSVHVGSTWACYTPPDIYEGLF